MKTNNCSLVPILTACKLALVSTTTVYNPIPNNRPH